MRGGVPAHTTAGRVPLRDAPASRALLDVVAIGLGVEALTPDSAVRLLTGHPQAPP